MDLPNSFSKLHPGPSSHHHYQQYSRGEGEVGYQYQSASVPYHYGAPYGSDAYQASNPSHQHSSGYHQHDHPYRYGGGLEQQQQQHQEANPYRYQRSNNNGLRTGAAAASASSSSSRRLVLMERMPSSNRYDNFKPSITMDRGTAGDSSMYGRKPAAKKCYDEDQHFYPSVPDHSPPAHNHRHTGKPMYDPEMPSLVCNSEHSSFEVSSDDDEDNMWDRKIRPGEKVGLSNGYFSEDEADHCSSPYYSSTATAATTKPHAQAVAAPAPASKAASKQQRIEVAPGEWLPLRGAAETWAAVQSDFYMPTGCVCCQQTIFCIQDASFVLCPTCKVVSPGFGQDSMEGGVGLGFTMEELAKWQNEIGRAQKEAAKRL